MCQMSVQSVKCKDRDNRDVRGKIEVKGNLGAWVLWERGVSWLRGVNRVKGSDFPELRKAKKRVTSYRRWKLSK